MTASENEHGKADTTPITRRRFLAGTGATVLAFTVLKPGLVRGAEANSKIDIGLIDDLVFKNSLDGALTAQTVATADLSVPTGILNAEFTLGRDVVEFYKDKYGEEAFGAYVDWK